MTGAQVVGLVLPAEAASTNATAMQIRETAKSHGTEVIFNPIEVHLTGLLVPVALVMMIISDMIGDEAEKENLEDPEVTQAMIDMGVAEGF